jgi:hypothetical protein
MGAMGLAAVTARGSQKYLLVYLRLRYEWSRLRPNGGGYNAIP